MIVLGVVILLFVATFFIKSSNEGFEEDYLGLAIKSIEFARHDKRLKKHQIIALEDALSYANHIKYNVKSIGIR